MVISLIATWAKRLGAASLAFVVFWNVAQHADPQRGKVIVHVPQPGVIVSVDNQSYRVESIAESPVVCELGPGIHVVKVRRGESLLGEEGFLVEPGQDVILCPASSTAMAPVDAASEGGSVAEAQATPAASLAVPTRKPAVVHHEAFHPASIGE